MRTKDGGLRNGELGRRWSGPTRIRLHDRLGLAPGDYLDVELDGDHIVMTRKAIVEKRLAESLADIRDGRVHGPFRSVRVLLRSLHKTKKTKTS